ncbi:putative ABC transport system permease protein [Algoriphagus hitonicola]|uniref:Putative ABC transport system permease protein n=1 Tax=Algoriphagus hitonicola TaxID=435880 RepID=A0A1I2Q8T0_9BACT|nr:putative ABC transport system permease protein [Algoriphagus hitonicola]
MGLSLGLGTCLIIFSYWSFEKSYDQFHPNHERIFRIAQVKSIEEGGEVLNASVFSKVGQAFLNQETIAESLVRIHRNGPNTSIQLENEAFLQPGIIGAEESFFDLFQFDFISGSSSGWISTPQSVVLTESTATKLFGDEDPLGKPIQINGSFGIYGNDGYQEFKNYTVAGVIEDIPGNTHLDFSAIISLNIFTDPEREFSNWGDQFYTYVKLNATNTQAELEESLDRFAKEKFSESGISFFSQPLSSIHLGSNLNNEFKPNGSQSVLWMLGLIASIVLIIACANYINFSLARSLQRKKELHLRKIFWAKKHQLFQQLTIEAFLINLIAFTLAIILLILLQPLLEYLIGFDLIASLLLPKNIITWLVVLLLGVILSGIYPAWVISSRSFKSFYRGGFQPPSFQKPLIIFQFGLTIFVIAFSLLIYSQINFMRTQNLGFNTENVLVLSGPSVEAENVNLDQRVESFKNFLTSRKEIGKVSSANFVPGQAVRGKAEGYIRQLGQPEESAHTYFFTQMDTDFLKNFEFKISAGRTFSKNFTDQNGIIINEEASRLLGFTDPIDAIGKKIYYRKNTTPEIIGVVKNFQLFGLQKQYEPLIFELGENPNQFLYLTVKDSDEMLADLSVS